MTLHDHNAGLDATARAALSQWLDTEVPTGFADRVVARLDLAVLPLPVDDEPLLPPLAAVAAPQRRQRRPLRRYLAIGACALMAAVLVLFVGRTLRARAEDEARALRVATDEVAPSSLVELRTGALATLAAECTPCHSSTSGRADPDALHVFDVDDPRWFLSMSERQLDVAVRRLGGAAEAGEFRVYVDAELAHRRGSAPL